MKMYTLIVIEIIKIIILMFILIISVIIGVELHARINEYYNGNNKTEELNNGNKNKQQNLRHLIKGK